MEVHAALHLAVGGHPHYHGSPDRMNPRESFWHFPEARMKRLTPQQQAALTVLRDAGSRGCTGDDLYRGGAGHRYSQRVKELRDWFGFKIPDAEPAGKSSTGTSTYRFVLEHEPPQAPETGVGANQEPVHRSWVDDATPIPVCGAERLFELEEPSETVSAVTGKRAA